MIPCQTEMNPKCNYKLIKNNIKLSSIKRLGNTGISSNVIGSLSLVIQQYPPPERRILVTVERNNSHHKLSFCTCRDANFPTFCRRLIMQFRLIFCSPAFYRNYSIIIGNIGDMVWGNVNTLAVDTIKVLASGKFPHFELQGLPSLQ